MKSESLSFAINKKYTLIIYISPQKNLMRVKQRLGFVYGSPEAESETKTWVQLILEVIPGNGCRSSRGMRKAIVTGPLQ